MSPEELFVHSLNDLHAAVTSRNEYEVLQASKVLRQLILDGDRLMIAVNRNHALRISFSITVPLPPPDFVLKDGTWIVIEGLNPGESNRPPSELTLDDFLKVVIGGSRGQLVTIKDVIKFAAINLGGVHFKPVASEDDQKLVDLMKADFFPTEKPLIAALRVIGKIVLDAMLPLRNKVIGRAEFENSDGVTALFSLCIYPSNPDEDNYIFDCGTDAERNRLSVYVDGRGELTLRLIDQAGKRFYIRAGEMGKAIPYGTPQIVLCEVAKNESKMLVSLAAGIWDHAEVLSSAQFCPELDVKHFVVGSDCSGKKKTHMLVLGQLVISRALTADEKEKSATYFQAKSGEEIKGVMFKGNQFLHSDSHPNFKKA